MRAALIRTQRSGGSGRQISLSKRELIHLIVSVLSVVMLLKTLCAQLCVVCFVLTQVEGLCSGVDVLSVLVSVTSLSRSAGEGWQARYELSSGKTFVFVLFLKKDLVFVMRCR